MKHKIIYQAGPEAQAPEHLKSQIKTTVRAALRAEGVDLPCEINVLITDDEGIRRINDAMRDLDQPTDVLSFPMFQLAPGDKPSPEDADPETGLVPLGDMVLSLERARSQAEEYGHSLEREVCYLTVHSVLHLLGYDHLDEGPQKARMRDREEKILAQIGSSREEKEGESTMEKTHKKVVLTKIEPEYEAAPEENGSFMPLVVAGVVFAATFALCRGVMKQVPFRKGK